MLERNAFKCIVFEHRAGQKYMCVDFYTLPFCLDLNLLIT